MKDAAGPTPERVTLARIVRPRGRIGEVAAEILTDFPQRLTRLRQVYLHDPRARNAPPADEMRRVKKCWLSPSRGGQAIFLFDGVDSIDDAKKLVGCEVQIPFTDRAKLPDAHYYVSDLTGCEVWQRSGAKLGEVRDVQFPGATPLLVVETSRGEALIPLAQEICVLIDPAARRIEVELPEGLLEINS